jgi:hypothetical protein
MNIKLIDIFATQYVENIANSLSTILNSLNIITTVNIRNITNEDINVCINDRTRFMFLFCPQWVYPSDKNIQQLPVNKYFFYQLEQFDKAQGQHISNEFVYKLMRNAKHIFDYSKINIQYYSKYPFNIPNNKVSHLLPSLVKYNISDDSNYYKPIDVLFVGTLNNRRKNIINNLLANNINIYIPQNCFGNNLTQIIKKSKIFLNIRFSNSVILETCRLHEALLLNDIYIISEMPGSELEAEYINMYKSKVHFINVISNNSEQLIKTIKIILSIYDNKHSRIFDPTNINNKISDSLLDVFSKI